MVQEVIDKYRKAIREAEKWGNRIGQMLVEALKSAIPDINYSVGWAEGGIVTIYLRSDKYRAIRVPSGKSGEYVGLGGLIEEAFGDFTWYIDCPSGIWLPPDVAEKAKKALEGLKR